MYLDLVDFTTYIVVHLYSLILLVTLLVYFAGTGESEEENTESKKHRDAEKEPLPEWPGRVNPHTGEKGGPKGPEPTRFGDWERKGRVSDF